MDIDIQQFQPVFIEECREGLDAMEAELLTLRPGNADKEAINTIFRVAHSIKGGAGTFGFSALTEFTHVAETLLDDIRGDKLALLEGHISLLLQSGDCLRAWVDLIEQGITDAPSSAEALKLKFEQYLTHSEASGDIHITADTSSVSENSGWSIHFIPGIDILKQGNEPRLIFSELDDMGDLSVQPNFVKIPDFASLDPHNLYIDWQLSLLGKIDQTLINEAFEWVEDESEITVTALAQVAHEIDTAVSNSVNVIMEKETENNLLPSVQEPSNTAQTKVAKANDSGSIRVSIDKVDSLINMVGELVITQAMLGEIGNNFTVDKLGEFKKGLMQLSQHTREMQDSVMKIRMLPIQFAFNRIPRMVRDLSAKLDKNVELRVTGEETEVDKIMLEKLSDPIIHLVRNALDHGIETTQERQQTDKPDIAYLDINAFHQGGKIIVEIRDDGRGLNRHKIKQKAIEKGVITATANLTDEQIDELIFAPGFSTVETISDISGRGVGMDVVKRNIESLGGDISVATTPGSGSCFAIRLPLTLSIMDGQLVKVGEQTYILPIMSIIESLQLNQGAVTCLADHTEVFKLRDEFIPIIRLHRILNQNSHVNAISEGLIVVVETSKGKYGLFVDDLAAQQQVVIKNLEDNFMKVPCVSGATILGNGTVALILDITDIVKLMTQQLDSSKKSQFVAA